MKLCFDSIEEVKAFVASLKGTRGKRGEDEGPSEAPAPLAPPTGPAAGSFPGPTQGFAGPGASAGFPGGSPVQGAAQQVPSPAVQALVSRIATVIDGAIKSGQPTDAIVNWFRGELTKHGIAEAAQATLELVKTAHLYKLNEAQLADIAKLMNA